MKGEDSYCTLDNHVFLKSLQLHPLLLFGPVQSEPATRISRQSV